MFKQLMTLLLALQAVFPAVVKAQTESWNDENMNIIHSHVVPAYQHLADASTTLEQSSREFCQSVATGESLAKLQQDFHAAMDAWMAIQHIRVGRVELFMRYHRYQLWPDKHNTGTRQLSQLLAEKDPEPLREDNFGSTSVAVQGFTALERVLFDSGNKYLVGDKAKTAYPCELVKAISHNLAVMSGQLVGEWQSNETTPFQKLFVTDERALADIKQDTAELSVEAAARFLSLMQTQLESIADQKLGRPMDKSASKAKPQRAESWRSQRSMRNVELNLQAVYDMYLKGFAPSLLKTAEGIQLDKQLREQFNQLIKQAGSFEQPLEKMVRKQKQRARVEQFANDIRAVKGLLSSQVTTLLGLPQMFNALDGD